MIDEHESHRLGVLLQDLFRDVDHQTVTIMVNPSGIAMEGRFSRVDEYAHIVYFGDSGRSRGQTTCSVRWGRREAAVFWPQSVAVTAATRGGMDG